MKISQLIKSQFHKLTGLTLFKKLPFGNDPIEDISFYIKDYNPKTVFDIGANVGATTLSFQRSFKHAQIWSFEPMRSTYDQLISNSPDSIKCFNIGFGEEKTEKEILASKYDSTMNSFEAGDHAEATKEIVVIETLDGFCEENGVAIIDLLKIDTEGFDLKVLKGARKMLDKKNISVIMVECGMNHENTHHVPLHQIVEFLEDKSYILFGIYNQIHEWPTKKPYLRVCDAVFIKKDLEAVHLFP